MTKQRDSRTPVVYWRPGCPYCALLKLGLRVARIPFHAINIWQDKPGAEFVRAHNGGDALVPTVQIGSAVLSNPSIGDIQLALGKRAAQSSPPLVLRSNLRRRAGGSRRAASRSNSLNWTAKILYTRVHKTETALET